MNVNVKWNNRDPVYIQVIQYFKEQIASGRLEAGQEIPSRRELAAMLKINPNTAQRAYKEMEEQGLIHTERNFPSRITTDKAVLGSVREELIEAALETFIEAIRPMEIPAEELVEMVKTRYMRV
ncbi:GntR family transcriptional regulator [Heyndrickxia acidiproducens]|uniref:GntR family transcriptional regulator n=1 Tax=Heyndrickxia acidiproducens TaxID=1121084 RepID=UPI000381E6AF|nr:GntR family transcriptional regulator [Heyndrickxia acidiproducens]